MKKNIIGFVGFVLVVGTLLGGTDRFISLFDWSTGEMVGYNFATLASIIGGAWMVRYSLRKEEKVSETADSGARDTIKPQSETN